jgi:hypothetical protein
MAKTPLRSHWLSSGKRNGAKKRPPQVRLALEVLEDRTVPSFFPPTTNGIHVFEDQLPSGLSTAMAKFLATHTDGTQKQLLSDITLLRSYNSSYTLLHYQLGTGNSPYNYIINNQWASDWTYVNQQESWFAHQTYTSEPQSGSDLTSGRVGNSTGWNQADIANSNWQRYTLGQVFQNMAATGANGWFADSYTYGIGGGGYDGTIPTRYQNTNAANPADWPGGVTWTDQLGNWAQAIENAFAQQNSSKGTDYKFIPNLDARITSWEPNWYNNSSGVPIIDGAFLESFGQTTDASDWALSMNRGLSLTTNGKIVIMQPYLQDTPDSATGQQERNYYLGTYLLLKGDETYVNMFYGTDAQYFPEYQLNLGTATTALPTDVSSYLWNGVYRRDFQNGFVLVNPGTTSHTLNLGGTYQLVKGSGGGTLSDSQIDASGNYIGGSLSYTNMSSITLGGGTAAIFLNTSTVSGTNSTASFATASVASGSTDIVTVVVKDSTGAAITGLSNSAFNLSVSGGTSAGTFGSVTETSTKGTYTAMFTGTTAGTASKLTAVVNGVTLTSQPTVTVTVGPVSGSTSTASFASPTVASGSTDLLMIVVKDAAGNAVTGLSNSAFALSLAGGTSTGMFSAVVETATKGTYTATFTAAAAGTADTLTSAVNSVTLITQPTVQVLAGGVSGTNSTVSLANAGVASGSGDVVTIKVQDGGGNAVTGLSNSAFSLSLAGGTSAGTFSAVTETATKGTYTATFTGTTAGTASTLTVGVSGVTIAQKPTVTVTVGPVSGSTSTASFASATVASGSTDLLTIAVKDAAGNAVTGLSNSAFALSLAGGTSTGTLSSVAETATKGTYTTTFTATAAGTADTLTTTVSSVTLTAKPTVQVLVGGINGINSTVSFANPSVAAGNGDVVTVKVQDGGGNTVSGLSSSSFALSLAGGSSTGTFSAVIETATKGTYTATFTGGKAGTASSLTCTIGGVTLAQKPTVMVTVGSVSSSVSTVSFASASVASGSTDVVTLVIKDAGGNTVSGLASSAFTLSLTGGTSAGTFGAVTESVIKGTYIATFTATTAGTASKLTAVVNGVTLTSQPTVTVTATTAGQPPTVNPVSPQTVGDGNTLTVTITATSPSGSALTYSLAPGTLPGVTINAQTGVVTLSPSEWTGTAPGVYTVTVDVALASNPQFVSTTSFTLTVGPSSTNQGSGIAARSTAALGLTQSAEYYSNIIVAAYHKFLGRAPEPSGLAFWLDLMQNHGLSDEHLEAGFIGSTEYINNHGGQGAGWVQGMYQNLLGRAPAQWEVQYWVNQLANGMLTTDIAYGFAASREREAQRVAADYQQFVGRSASPAEVNYWVNVFLNGGSNEVVIAGFVSSQEYFHVHGNNIVDWLFAAYRTTLNRQPDAAGYQFWLNRLN